MIARTFGYSRTFNDPALWATRSAGWVARKRHVPRPAAHRLQPQPTTAGRFAPVGYPAYSRHHNAWAHAWQIKAPTATWTVAPPPGFSDSDSEEEEESEAEEPGALAARLSHLRAPASDPSTSTLLNE